MKQILISGTLILSVLACHSPNAAAPSATDSASSSNAMSATLPPRDTVKTYPVAMLDNKKDPVCGMPAAAGMQDTIHLNGKVIGFCSDECKNNYLKNPNKYAVEYK